MPQRRQRRKKASGARPSGTHNHLERNFHAAAPNTKWVTDITYIRKAEHWLYLCIVLYLYSGLVVGWSMSPRQARQLVVQAVLMALRQRPTRRPVILTRITEEYQRFLEAHQVICSMSAVGSCADNNSTVRDNGVAPRSRGRSLRIVLLSRFDWHGRLTWGAAQPERKQQYDPHESRVNKQPRLEEDTILPLPMRR